MKNSFAKIIVEGGYNDAVEIKYILGDTHRSEFRFNNLEEAKIALNSVYEQLKNRQKFINYFSETLLFGNAKATINVY